MSHSLPCCPPHPLSPVEDSRLLLINLEALWARVVAHAQHIALHVHSQLILQSGVEEYGVGSESALVGLVGMLPMHKAAHRALDQVAAAITVG
jgi:hypothetical protein